MDYLKCGLSFNEKHSLKDYGMFLSEPPDFGTPEAKTYTVDIPGRDGVLDYTESMTGEPVFDNRDMKFVFATMISPEYREAFKSRLLSDLNGKNVTVIYDLDADWEYTGRAAVEFDDVMSWKMKIIITVDAYPYKLERGNTIITVTPDTFDAETIFMGQGTAAQNINSIFMFGTKANPQLDLTQFSKLVFEWDEYESWGTAALQINDAAGDTFNSTFQGTQTGDHWKKELNVTDITGISKAYVYRILCQGRRFVRLYGVTTASATIMVPVDRMTVVPVWTASAACTVFINGRKFSLPAGQSQNYNCRLREGENQVSFISDSDETTIEIAFRNGRI